MLAGKVTLLLRKTLKDFDHVVYDAVSKPKVQRTTKKVCGLVNQTSQHPHKTEVSRGLKPIETLGNVAVSIGEALSLGRVEPRRGEGHCGLRLFALRRSKRKNPPLADARPSPNSSHDSEREGYFSSTARPKAMTRNSRYRASAKDSCRSRPVRSAVQFQTSTIQAGGHIAGRSLRLAPTSPICRSNTQSASLMAPGSLEFRDGAAGARPAVHAVPRRMSSAVPGADSAAVSCPNVV